MELSRYYTKLSKDLSNEMDQLSEEEYDRLSSEYFEVSDLFSDGEYKTSAIDSVIYSLSSMQENFSERDGDKLFQDVSKIDITESISYIKLKRFSNK
jgi:hypothetical protein